MNGDAAGGAPARAAWDWWWRGAALARARAWQAQAEPPPEAVHLQRAAAALEWADRALDPIDPLRSGSSLPLALSLYRQAVYWTLLARGGALPESPAGELGAMLAATPRAALLDAAGSEAELTMLTTLLATQSFIDDARASLAMLEPQLRAVRRFAHALLLRVEPTRAVERLLWQRRVRIGWLLLAFGGAFAFVAMTGRLWQGRDLAEGRPWRISSTLLECHPQRSECGGQTTDILFHTAEEKGPWFEIDLGAARKFALIEVENRKDCCADRAVPLVLEVSDDRARWREVARRGDPFESWRARFEPVSARFVRARVGRRSVLHLERVSVRRH